MTKLQPLTEAEKELYLDTITAQPQGDTRFVWRHQYDEQRDAIERELTKIRCDDPSKTEQHHAHDLNLNNIIQRYGIKDGSIPPAAVYPEDYFGDFTSEIDFRTALDRINDATDRFNRLPADLRARFNNDPVTMYNWVIDAQNVEEAVSLGLLNKSKIIQATLPENAGGTAPPIVKP